MPAVRAAAFTTCHTAFGVMCSPQIAPVLLTARKTHLGCRSARYTPAKAANACSPASVPSNGFPVNPGAAMPAVNGCHKQDYTVLIVVGRPVTH